MANPNFDEILTTTLNNHRDTLVDNVFTARPVAFFLKDAGNIKLVNGGAKRVEPIISSGNSTAESGNDYGGFDDYDTLALTAQTGITAAEYDWKQWYATIAISGMEEDKNAGEEEIIDLLEAKIMQAEETIIESMDDWLINGDGSSPYDKVPEGLEKLVKDTADTSIGGIDQTSDTWWAPGHTTTSAGALSLSLMRTGYNDVSVGNDQPKFILTTQALFEKYEGLLQPQERYHDTKTADAGFQNLAFKGAPVVYDANVVSGDMLFVNTRYLKLVGMKKTWFRPTKFTRPEDVDARYAQILCRGTVSCSNRARQGSIQGLT